MREKQERESKREDQVESGLWHVVSKRRWNKGGIQAGTKANHWDFQRGK